MPTMAPGVLLVEGEMRRTKLLHLSVAAAALLFMSAACQPALPGMDTGDTSLGLESDPLVNVAVDATVGIQDTVVQIPASVAANVCGVDVNLLNEEANSSSTPTCTATSSTTMEQLQPYVEEGQLVPATESIDTTGQQSSPQQDSNAPGKSEEAPQQDGNTPGKSEEAPK
jgi:hypothetical protein